MTDQPEPQPIASADKLITDTRASIIAKLDAATDFDAVLADIYSKAEDPESR